MGLFEGGGSGSYLGGAVPVDKESGSTCVLRVRYNLGETQPHLRSHNPIAKTLVQAGPLFTSSNVDL